MSEKVHVAMVIQDDFARVGGAQLQLAGLAPCLQANDVKVSIIARRIPGLRLVEDVNGVQIYRIPSPGPKNMASATFTLLALPLLMRLRPDIIHVHGLLSPLTTGMLGKMLAKAPLIAKVLRGGELGDLQRLRTKFLSSSRIKWMRSIVDKFFVISHEIDQELNEIGIPNARRAHLPNGVDTDKFSPISESEKRTMRASLQLPEDALVCVYSGRLVAEKRVDRLITAFGELTDKYPHALLLILGTGEQIKTLESMAGSAVRFIGFTDRVNEYLKAADVFVLPSATEGLSNAMLEALASSLAVVATSVGGAPDVIEHGTNGFLVNAENSGALKSAIDDLLADADLRNKLGSNARQEMIADYAFPVIASRMRGVYDDLLENRLATETEGLQT